MYSADIESKMLNTLKSQKQVDQFLERIGSGLTIKSVTDARVMIDEIAGMLKSKQVELDQQRKLTEI